MSNQDFIPVGGSLGGQGLGVIGLQGANGGQGGANGGVGQGAGGNGGGDQGAGDNAGGGQTSGVSDNNMNIEIFKAKFKAMQEESRVSKINAEKSRHRSPQIKRSISFLLNLQHKLEDLEEINSDSKQLFMNTLQVNTNTFQQVSDLISESKVMIEDEILKNRMASKSNAGWKTVQLYEEDNLFVGDSDAESKSKKFRAAERSANMFINNSKRRNSNRGGFRGGHGGRGGYSGGYDGHNNGAGGSGAGGSRGGYNNSFNNGFKPSGSNFQLGPCFNCKMTGHRAAQCPNPKVN